MTDGARAVAGQVTALPATMASGGGRARREWARNARRLRFASNVLMIAPPLGLAITSDGMLMGDRMVSAVTWLLAMLPAWLYVRTHPSRRRPIPFFPIIGLEFGIFFALQGILGATNVYGRFEQEMYVGSLTPEMYSKPVLLVLGGWLALLLGYWMVSNMLRRRPIDVDHLLNLDAATRWGFRILLFSVVLDVARRFVGLLVVLGGLVDFATNLSMMAVAVLAIQLVRGRLSPRQRLTFFSIVLALIFLRLGTSASGQMMMFVTGLVVAAWIGNRGRLSMRWVLIGFAGVAFFLAMRGVANEHRKTMELAGDLSFVGRSTLLVEIMADRVATKGLVPTILEGWSAASARTALLDLFTDVARQTPSTVPYWGGQTYLSLVGAFVPRFFWPDKPLKTLGWDFGHRYGYLASDDFTTTINLPYIVEFYANFGALAVLAGMLLVGVIYAALESFLNVPGQSIFTSASALVLLLPMINIESDFSLVFGGTFLFGGALWVVYRFLIRRLRRRERGRGAGPPRPSSPPRPGALGREAGGAPIAQLPMASNRIFPV